MLTTSPTWIDGVTSYAWLEVSSTSYTDSQGAVQQAWTLVVGGNVIDADTAFGRLTSNDWITEVKVGETFVGPDLSVSYDAQGNYWGYDANSDTYTALEAGSGSGSRLTNLGNQDVSGSSSLEIQVLDPNNGDAQLSIETIPISVTEVNDAPTAGTVTVTTDEDNAVVITEAALLAGADDVDTDNANLTVELSLIHI